MSGRQRRHWEGVDAVGEGVATPPPGGRLRSFRLGWGGDSNAGVGEGKPERNGEDEALGVGEGTTTETPAQGRGRWSSPPTKPKFPTFGRMARKTRTFCVHTRSGHQVWTRAAATVTKKSDGYMHLACNEKSAIFGPKGHKQMSSQRVLAPRIGPRIGPWNRPLESAPHLGSHPGQL